MSRASSSGGVNFVWKPTRKLSGLVVGSRMMFSAKTQSGSEGTLARVRHSRHADSAALNDGRVMAGVLIQVDLDCPYYCLFFRNQSTKSGMPFSTFTWGW